MSYSEVIEIRSTLVSRNITVMGKRTSIRLEPEMWRALKDIARREQCSIHDLCSLISIRKNSRTSLTAAIRVFLMLYYRASSTEEGHHRAGHGSFESMKIRAGIGGTGGLQLVRSDMNHVSASALPLQDAVMPGMRASGG